MITNNEIICISLDEKSPFHDSIKKENFSFYFKYLDFSKAKIQIYQYQVPIWIKQIHRDDLNNFEFSVKKVIENIDGITYVKKIALNCDLSLDYVIYILYNLILTDFIAIVDIFQFSNIYRANPNMKQFSTIAIKEEFIKFCRANVENKKNYEIHKNLFDFYYVNNKEEFNFMESLENLDDMDLFSFYCVLSKAQDVNSFLKKVKNFGLFISLFVAFGVYKKIIRRVHIFVLEKSKDSIKECVDNKEFNFNE